MKNKHIYACIYIRTLLNNIEQDYYEKNAVLNLHRVELEFARHSRPEYDKIVKLAEIVWNRSKEEKGDGYMIQTAPTVTGMYYGSKELQTLVPKIIFDRMMDKYMSANDDKYEARGYKLAKHLYEITQEVIDDSNANNNNGANDNASNTST